MSLKLEGKQAKDAVWTKAQAEGTPSSQPIIGEWETRWKKNLGLGTHVSCSEWKGAVCSERKFFFPVACHS